MVSIIETCRACLSVIPQQLVHFSEKIEVLGGTMTYAECFQKCTQLPALDVYPQILCIDCAVTLHRVYFFIKKAQESDQELRLKYAFNASGLIPNDPVKQEDVWLPDDLHSSDVENQEFSIDTDPSQSKRTEFEDNGSFDSSELCNSTVKDRILKGIYKLTKKRGRSKVWNIFSPITNENGVELEFTACRRCNNVYKFNSKSTSNLLKHKCYVLYSETQPDLNQEDSMSKYLEDTQVAKPHTNHEEAKEKYQHDVDAAQVEVNQQDKEVCSHLATEWIVENCRPLSIIDDSGLKKLAQFLVTMGSSHGKNVDVEKLLPRSTTLAHNVNYLYEFYSNKIKQEIQQIKPTGLAISCDLWTDEYLRQTYLAASIHYIKNGQLFSRLLGVKSVEKNTKSADYVKPILTHLMHDFDLELNERTITVTDRREDNVPIFKEEPHISHIFCVNHLIDDCIESSIEDEPDVKLLCKYCTELVKHFKNSGIDSKFTSSLKDYSRTRWKSIYNMMLAISSSFDEIIQILTVRNEMSWLNAINWKLVNQLLALLKHFKVASVKLEGDNCPTIHLAYVHIHQLKKICMTQLDDIAAVKSLKEKLTVTLDTIAFKNMTIIHKIALYMFPPANALSQFSDAEKELVRCECKRLSMLFMDGSSEENNENSPAESTTSLYAGDVFSDFIKPVVSEDRISNEMATYESINVAYHDNFDVLQWWHLHKTQYPRLYKLSTFILAAPASSAASEKVFARARNIITDEQSMADKNLNTVNQIVFKHYNFPHTKLTFPFSN